MNYSNDLHWFTIYISFHRLNMQLEQIIDSWLKQPHYPLVI